MQKFLAVLLFTAGSIGAAPAITKLEPTSGAAWTPVYIHTTAAEFCTNCPAAARPRVAFGGLYSPYVRIIDTHIVEASAPPQFPKTVDVRIEYGDVEITAENAFTYGPVWESFERILLPLLVPMTPGAHGSLFLTHLRLANESPYEPIYIYGLRRRCLNNCVDADLRDVPLILTGGESLDAHDVDYDYGSIGRFVYVSRSAHTVFATLRASDSTRDAENFGTALPIVREPEFIYHKPLKLLGVPLHARFRSTLRIYATMATTATVAFGNERYEVSLTPGENIFEPAYAQFSTFPAGEGTIDVTVTPQRVSFFPGTDVPLYWAFITVTNNDTQLITTITPGL